VHCRFCNPGYTLPLLQSLLQAPVSVYLDTSFNLPPHSIHLFLHIAFMLMTTGQMQHDALSSILVLFFSLISPDYKEWPMMPSEKGKELKD
jgi:hypothetical protein